MCDLTNPIYTNETAARKHLEALRWPNGPICPKCGSVGNAHEMTGASTRPGLWKCRDCRKPFSVTVNTVFERSKIPLGKWLLATHLLCSSKKGMSSHQLHRMLGVTYKTAWFMSHRIREAMRDDKPGTMGGPLKYVEADETYIGTKKGSEQKLGRKPKGGWGHKNTVFSLVERGGKVRSVHISGNTFDGVKEALNGVSPLSFFMTDEAKMYNNLGKGFRTHSTVNHSIKEYARGDAYTNTVEGYFSIFKRGMKGIYQHCSSDHLHRYLAEFDFRYNHRVALDINDRQRTLLALQGISGKRLMYKRPANPHSAS